MINMKLARARNLSDDTVTAIQELHKRLDQVLARPSMLCQNPKEAVEIVQSLEYTLQILWGFPTDIGFHIYWFELKGCTCPKMDNRDRFGSGCRVVTENCPYHCIDRLAETWEDRRFT